MSSVPTESNKFLNRKNREREREKYFIYITTIQVVILYKLAYTTSFSSIKLSKIEIKIFFQFKFALFAP